MKRSLPIDNDTAAALAELPVTSTPQQRVEVARFYVFAALAARVSHANIETTIGIPRGSLATCLGANRDHLIAWASAEQQAAIADDAAARKYMDASDGHSPQGASLKASGDGRRKFADRLLRAAATAEKPRRGGMWTDRISDELKDRPNVFAKIAGMQRHEVEAELSRIKGGPGKGLRFDVPTPEKVTPPTQTQTTAPPLPTLASDDEAQAALDAMTDAEVIQARDRMRSKLAALREAGESLEPLRPMIAMLKTRLAKIKEAEAAS